MRFTHSGLGRWCVERVLDKSWYRTFKTSVEEEETVKKIRRLYWPWRQGDSLFQEAWVTMFNVHGAGCLLRSACRVSQLWKSEEHLGGKRRRAIRSVQFSRSVVSNSLWPHGLQHARLHFSSPIPRVYSNSCPSSQWCHHCRLNDNLGWFHRKLWSWTAILQGSAPMFVLLRQRGRGAWVGILSAAEAASAGIFSWKLSGTSTYCMLESSPS